MKRFPIIPLLLVPLNLGLHFPFGWSYVRGLLVDYLIPTLHSLDIFLIAYFLLSIYKNKKITCKPSFPLFLLLSYFALSFMSAFVGVNRGASIYKATRMILYIPLLAFTPWDFKIASKEVFLWVAIYFESVLGFIQFMIQKSVFGFSFLGEPTFNFYTSGVSKVSIFKNLKVAPYGTFPHPNALAFYISFLLLLIIVPKRGKIGLKEYMLSLFPLILLFLTGSIHVYISFFLVLLSLFLLRIHVIPRYILVLSFSLILVGLTFLSIYPKTPLPRGASFSRRHKLATVSYELIRKHPLSGIGLNNFTMHAEDYGALSLWERFVQPVHNIYLLTASESGIFTGLSLFFLILVLLFIEQSFFFFLLLFIFLASFFDHYLLTLPQTSLIFWLTVSSVLPRIDDKHDKHSLSLP